MAGYMLVNLREMLMNIGEDKTKVNFLLPNRTNPF